MTLELARFPWAQRLLAAFADPRGGFDGLWVNAISPICASAESARCREVGGVGRGGGRGGVAGHGPVAELRGLGHAAASFFGGSAKMQVTGLSEGWWSLFVKHAYVCAWVGCGKPSQPSLLGL
jgi:hypothetical protein